METPSRKKLSTGEYLDKVQEFVSSAVPIKEEASEVPKEVQADFESILTTGFIKYKTICFGVPIIWKSLTPKENEFLKDITWGGEQTLSQSLSYHLAASVYTLDGINILPFRDDILHKLSSSFLRLPYFFMRDLSYILLHLESRVRRIQSSIDDLIESPVSRGLWEIYKRDKKGFYSGAKGTESLGISVPKAYWLTAMGMIDLRETMDRGYDLATYLGAFANPKAAKSIMSRKTAREDAKRQEKELEEKLGKERLTAPVKTKQDLVNQLTNSIRGVQDKHDEVVRKYEQETWQKMVTERQRLIAKSRQNPLPNITMQQKIIDVSTIKREMELRNSKRFVKKR